MTDAELAKRAQKGDREAFLALIHRYRVPLYKLAYRFAGSAERAEDVCQEILIRAFLNIRKFDLGRPFQPWLMRVASNVALNWVDVETRRYRHEAPLSDDFVFLTSESPEGDLIDRIERNELIEALALLPAEIRLLVVMRFALGLTFREISEQTGIKLPTVAFRVSKGIDQLRTALSVSEVHEA